MKSVFKNLLVLAAVMFSTNYSVNSEEWKKSDTKINIQITNEEGTKTNLVATLADNKTATEFLKKLSENEIELQMKDYSAFEKFARLPFNLPQEDSNITTKPGDLMIAWGNTLAIYYGQNNYSFSRLGFLDAVEDGTITRNDLMEILGKGIITARFSVKK